MGNDLPTPTEPSKPLTYLIVGGAAGVGKSTLLEHILDANKLSTGTLFKSHMALQSRDDVRISDWSQFENVVTDDLIELSIQSLNDGIPTILDTHFAAKLNGKNYRIGLGQSFLFSLLSRIAEFASAKNQFITIYIVLISCDVHDLLERRRLDKSRSRDLVPSDCYAGLRQNRTFANEYYSQAVRARNAIDDGQCSVKYVSIENKEMRAAISELQGIFR